ncbi:MAG TPA: M48 family metalloprotease [Caulobacteraceae bacterium]
MRRIGGDQRPWRDSLVATLVVALPLALAKAAFDAILISPAEALAPQADNMVLALVVIPPLTWLARRAPRAWPWIAGGAFVALCLCVGWAPYAFGGAAGLTPAPPGPVTAGVQQLMASAGLAGRDVWLSPDPAFDADVTGAFGHATVILGRQTLAWPPAEVRAYVGHVMGHWAHGDVFALFLIDGLSGLVALLAIQRLVSPLARALSGRGVSTPAAPRALPAAALICLAAYGAATLAGAAYLRFANVRADAYALEMSREPDGLAAVLVRTWNHQSLDPNPLEAALFYTHPPLPGRLAHAMTWKAAPGG